MTSNANAAIARNRQKKIGRFVEKMDATMKAVGAVPESSEAAEVALAQLMNATGEKWTGLAIRLNENTPSEWTRLGIANVYRVRAGMTLLTEPWKLPAPPPRMCRYFCEGKNPVEPGIDACSACDVKILCGYVDPKNQAELRKEEREGAR